MKSRAQFSIIDAHSAGAPARVVVGGVPHVPGSTMAEKRAYLMESRDDIRKLLMYEPRGSSEMCGSILLSPCDPSADVGVVFLESGGWPQMCGAGTIGAATVLVETGQVKVVEPVTTIRFDTPAGLVVASVDVDCGTAKGVTIENVPSFVVATDQKLDLPGFGQIAVDISYGGNLYVLVPAERFGLEIKPHRAEALVQAGRLVRETANAMLRLDHPLVPAKSSIPMVIFTEEKNSEGSFRNLVFFGGSGVDRSPGGTGTSARMALRYQKGEQRLGETFLHESIIGSRFEGKLVRTVSINGIEAVVPQIRGRAHIIGFSTFLIDPEDPFPEGFGVGYGGDAMPATR